MTRIKISDKIISDIKGADFLCQNGLLVGAENETVSLMSTERSPILSEDKMFDEKAYMKQWQKENKDKIKLYNQRYYKKNPWAKTCCNMRAHCRRDQNYLRKGIKIFLDTKDMKFLWFRDKAYLLKQPSIDRINNDGHYTLKNCRYIELEKNIYRSRIGRFFSKETRKKLSFTGERNIKLRKRNKLGRLI